MYYKMTEYIFDCLILGVVALILILAVCGLGIFICTNFPKIVLGSFAILFVFGVGALVRYLLNWWCTDHRW